MKLIYVLIDGVSDITNDVITNTPLEIANTKNLDKLVHNGVMGHVITVKNGIAPESDIAVLNMLGYNFDHSKYVGRGMIESVGSGIQFQNGDVVLRGNFATLDDNEIIIDRRAGRNINKKDALAISNEIEKKIKFSKKNTAVIITPTIGHRVIIRIRCNNNQLSANISNTDPAYDNNNGMGIAKSNNKHSQIKKCMALDNKSKSILTAKLINEFTAQSKLIMKNSTVNKSRKKQCKKLLNCIIMRDASDTYPSLIPINKKYDMRFSCIADMPVEIGIAKILNFNIVDISYKTSYQQRASNAIKSLKTHDAVYVHLKGPDEFGHDGDFNGKVKCIEEIDKKFFGYLLNNIDTSKTAIIVSADHSTPCINKKHSDDPVPLVISYDLIKKDKTKRFTEKQAKKGNIGLLKGSVVLSTALNIIKS